MATSKWSIDPLHSEIQFKVKHLMITNVTGSFSQFAASITADDEKLANAKVTFTAEVDSISTGNDQRDGHLKSDDFFSAAKFPQVRFTSTSASVLNGKVEGLLTIRDVTRPVTLDVEFGGIVVDGYGQTKAGFSVSGKINRKDFELQWSAVTEAGGVVVSDEVRIVAEVQFVKEA